MKQRELNEQESQEVITALTILAEASQPAAIPDVAKYAEISRRRAYFIFAQLENKGLVYRSAKTHRPANKSGFLTNLWKASQPRKAETWRTIFKAESCPSVAEFLDAIEELHPSCSEQSGYFSEYAIGHGMETMENWLDGAVQKGIATKIERDNAIVVLFNAQRVRHAFLNKK